MTPLPPKIPSQKTPPLTTNITISPPPPPQPPQKSSWTDDFLDFTSTKRATHRRSMSDSIAFLDPPRSSLQGNDVGGFDRLDDEQLMSMFSDDIIVNNNEDNYRMYDNNSNSNGNSNTDTKEQECFFLKREPQEIVERDCDNVVDDNNRCDDVNDPYNFDPKRIKRVLANRQSAQRSRVRKLQYISELERSVTSLETEVSILSPRVAYLDHHRVILNVDNSALKQRIAALAQDKIFMDAHQEALKKEIERLRQIYHHQQQNMKKMCNMTTSATIQQPISDHNIGCTDKEQLMI